MSVTYKDFKRYNKNGYIVVLMDHHNSFISGEDVCVYEHVLVAEEILGRRLLKGEVVHHLDCNRSNNSPDNLLILSNPMHSKLHGWMGKYSIIPTETHSERIALGCIRCKNCEFPISFGFKYCSSACSIKRKNLKLPRPTKESLEQQIKLYPLTTLGVKYGVSDNAVRKWCKSYGIELPNRLGYWAKQRSFS